MVNRNNVSDNMYRDLSSIRAQHSFSTTESDIEDLMKMVFAMWELLKEKGATDDELNRACSKVDLLMRHSTDELFRPMPCNKCKRLMQRTNSIRYTCPYCENIVYQHQFAKYSAVIDGKYDPDAEIPSYSPCSDETEAEPYDITKDLGFE